MPLRQYQISVKEGVKYQWSQGKRRVMPVLPTGAGKTKIMASMATEKTTHTLGLAMAHRSELVGQISVALASEGLQHNIIASKGDIRTICDMHMEEFGRVLYNPHAEWYVASVDTLIRRADVDRWAPHVSMGFCDEGHHVLRDNKWGKQILRFENAYWMLPTATPCRADGRGLGSHASGVVDALVVGPDMRWMIEQGFLTDFVVRTPKPDDLDMSDVHVTDSGEYNQKESARAVKRSTKIIGSVVETYLEHTPGKLGIVFAVDREHALQLTSAFNERDIKAEFLCAEDSTETRRNALRRFRKGETKVLVNIDLFGEGFDLPAIEVVMFARPTASYSLFVQQWGRALRLMISPVLMGAWDTYTPEQRRAFIAASAKPIAHIHDHVGNMMHFGGPPIDAPVWDLDDAKKRGKPNTIPTRLCVNPACQERYERIEPCCPFCGMEPPPPPEPKRPEEVDGDLVLFTREMLDELYAKKKQIDGDPLFPFNASKVVINSIKKAHAERKLAQQSLRELIPMVLGGEPRRAQRRFFHRYGIDVMTAQTLGATEANKLREQILADLTGE